MKICVKRIKFAVTFDVPWPHQVSLVDVVKIDRFIEIGILKSFGNVWRFF